MGSILSCTVSKNSRRSMVAKKYRNQKTTDKFRRSLGNKSPPEIVSQWLPTKSIHELVGPGVKTWPCITQGEGFSEATRTEGVAEGRGIQNPSGARPSSNSTHMATLSTT